MTPEQILEIALVMYGNSCLSTDPRQRCKLEIPEKHVFNKVTDIEFRRRPDRSATRTEGRISKVSQWYDDLRNRGANRLWYVEPIKTIPSHEASIQADFNDGYELWKRSKNEYSNHLWTCVYEGFPKPHPVATEHPNLESAKTLMRQAFEECLAESRDVLKDEFYLKWFERALELLESDEREVSRHVSEFMPLRGYTLLTSQVLAGVYEGWAFWGMSDFGDSYPEDRSQWDRHDVIAGRLYEALLNGLLAGTNSVDTV